MKLYRLFSLAGLLLILFGTVAFRFEKLVDESTKNVDAAGAGTEQRLPRSSPWQQTGSGWIDSKESSGMAYFLFQSPPRIERYDLVTETWLTPISLADTPTAFAVDPDGLYIGFGRRVARFSLTGSNETHLQNTDTDIQSLFTIGQFLYINYSSYPYGKLLSLNKTTGQVIDSKQYLYDVLTGASVAPTKGKIFARDSGISPADIVQVILNSDGTLGGSSDSPYHGDYPNASNTFVFPSEGRVVDNAGIVYNTSDLTYSNSFGGSVDDIAFYGDLPIIRRGNTLIAFSNTLLETGRHTPAESSLKIYVANQNVYSFSIGDARGVRVLRIPVSLLTPLQPGQPINPNGLAYTPDTILLGEGEIVYLLSRTHLSIFRWSIAERRYLETIPLVDSPGYMAYSAATNRLYLAYQSGKLTQIRLNESTQEQPFANSPQSPMGLATAGEYVFVADPTGAWDSHFIYGPEGNLISQKDWNYYSSEYIWNAANRKMYFFRDGMSPNDLLSEDIASDGTIGAIQESPYHDSTGFNHPIRVAPDGSIVVLGSGRIYDAVSLAQINTLSNNIEDAIWGGGNLFTLRTFNSNSQVQKWGSTYGVTAASQIPGTPLKLLSINEGLLVITNFYGLPRFLISDVALNKVFASPTLTGLSASNNGPKPVGQATNLQATLVSGVGPISFTWAFGNGQIGSGQQVTYIYPAVGVYTAVVTASNPVDALTATTRITITEAAIAGLTIANNSPTILGQATTLSATVTGGNGISYLWAFGDGSTGSGKVITHTYPATGTYTALVTASNAVNTITATTRVTITTPSHPGPWYVSPDGSDNNDCISAATACKKITAALGKASSGGTVIVASGVYTENVTIAKNVTLQGAGPNSIINGNAVGSVFTINAGLTVTITDVTITNGYANTGGGILNRGFLTLNNSIINNNNVVNHGGGIYNVGGLVIVNNSTISNNSALNGGGLMNDSSGLVWVNTSTITGNRRANGGAIMNTNGGIMTVHNSTISGNDGATATIYAFSPLTVTHSTIANNSNFGLDAWGTTIRLANTIIVNNANNECVTAAGGAIVSLDYNLASDSSCNLVGAHDQPNTDPQFAPLADNGGNTMTHALLPGSPAIDAVPLASCLDSANTLVMTDQRGQVRPWDGNNDGTALCDIGAYEATGQEAAPARLQITPSSLNFSAAKGGNNPVPQILTIGNLGDGTLTWTASENLGWLNLSSLSGTAPATVTASVNIGSLSPGVYNGSIVVTSNGSLDSPQVVSVTLTLSPPAPIPLHLNVEAGYTTIKLAWNPINDPTVTAYRISRGVISNSLSAIATISNTVYFDADPALVANTAYCYQVAALRANNSVVTTSNTACTLFGQVALWIPDVWAAPGQTAVIPVNIRNATGLRIAASDIWLDFDRTVVEPLSIQVTPLSAGYQWAYSITNHSGFSRVKISVVGGSAPVLQGDGSLFWLEVQVVGASGAQTQLNLREFVSGTGGSTIYTPDDLFTPVPLTLQDGIFQVANAYILGDPNGNGVVEAVDAYIALQIASGKLTPTSQQLQASDVNGNGEVDAGDASMILYYAVHGEWPFVPVTGSRVQAAGAILLDLDDVSGLPGAGVVTTLRAQNLSGWAGGKFVIAYDPAVVESITNVTPTGLAQNFSGQFYDNGTGLLTLALADETPVSGSGAMATIALHLAPNATTGSQTQLTLVHAELNDIAGRDFATSALQQLIERGSGTVFIGAGQQLDAAVYLPVIVK